MLDLVKSCTSFVYFGVPVLVQLSRADKLSTVGGKMQISFFFVHTFLR